MNWKMILSLAALGVLVSALTVYGILPASIWFGIIVILVAAALLGNRVPQKLFLHGFLVGLIWTVLGGVLQYFGWDTMLANNPEIQAKLAEVPEGMDIRLITSISSLVMGLIYGVILGLLAMLFGKLLGEKPAPETTETPLPEQHDTTGQ